MTSAPRPTRVTRVRGIWRDDCRSVVPADRVRLQWASWEYTTELRAAAILSWVCVGVTALALAGLFLRRPPVRLQQSDGTVINAADVYHGRIRAGNSSGALDTALALGRQLIRARFAYDPWRLNAGLQSVLANATPRGGDALRRSLDRDALAMVVLGDSGVAQLREFGEGAYSYGEAPGRVHVVVPLIGRLWSRHVVFDGYRSGLPLAGEAHAWMVRDARGAWRLDSISGEVLDPKVVAWWRAYQMNARPLPAVVIQGEVVPAIGDSVWVASWRRGTSYRNQS